MGARIHSRDTFPGALSPLARNQFSDFRLNFNGRFRLFYALAIFSAANPKKAPLCRQYEPKKSAPMRRAYLLFSFG